MHYVTGFSRRMPGFLLYVQIQKAQFFLLKYVKTILRHEISWMAVFGVHIVVWCRLCKEHLKEMCMAYIKQNNFKWLLLRHRQLISRHRMKLARLQQAWKQEVRSYIFPVSQSHGHVLFYSVVSCSPLTALKFDLRLFLRISDVHGIDGPQLYLRLSLHSLPIETDTVFQQT